MSIELIIGLVVVAAGVALWYFNKDATTADLNNDGKVDVKDAVQAVENAAVGTAEVVKVAAKSAKKTATKAAAKATAKATGAATRKPRATKQK